jgi:hypothetical protein
MRELGRNGVNKFHILVPSGELHPQSLESTNLGHLSTQIARPGL